MIITFQGPAVGGVTPAAVTLAPGIATREGASVLEDVLDRDLQIVKPIRALTEQPMDRGGRRIPFSFEVWLKFSGEDALYAYITSIQANVDCSQGDTEKNGVLTLTGEAVAFTANLNQAVCQQIAYTPKGLSLKITYKFIGAYWS